MAEIAIAEEFEHRERSDHVQKRIGDADIQKHLRPSRHEAVKSQQHYGKAADHVDGEQTVKGRRPGQRPRNGERQRDKNGEDGSCEHHGFLPPSSQATRRFISSSVKPSALSRSSAWTQSVWLSSLASIVTVPGVSVIEFA